MIVFLAIVGLVLFLSVLYLGAQALVMDSRRDGRTVLFADIERSGSVAGNIVNGLAPKGLHGNISRTAQLATTIARAYTPGVRVLSGYRSTYYNSAIHGALNSQHLNGKAVDLAPLDGRVASLQAVVVRLIASGAIPEGGIGVYKTFLHYDWRGTRARWGSFSDSVQHGEGA